MKNIVWLASYPKSGNTWMRIFLTNLMQDRDEPADINNLKKTPIAGTRSLFDDHVGYDSCDLTHDEIDALRPLVYEKISNKAKNVYFMKVHDAFTYLDDEQPLMSFHASRAAIYFIRNPLDVAVSYANHAGMEIDQVIKWMNDESHCFCSKPGRLHSQLRQQLLTWSGHVQSWVDEKNINLFLMRYEDMHENPVKIFTKAVKFIGLEKSDHEIEKAIKFSQFSELQKQEQEKGFNERTPVCESFFFKGKVGYWRQILSAKQTDSIIKAHEQVMRRFGYLDENGYPVY